MEFSSKSHEKFKNGKLIPCFCAFRFENLIWDFYFNIILLQGFRLNLENKFFLSEMKNSLAFNFVLEISAMIDFDWIYTFPIEWILSCCKCEIEFSHYFWLKIRRRGIDDCSKIFKSTKTNSINFTAFQTKLSSLKKIYLFITNHKILWLKLFLF